jgi:YVTN family beta-propeller protein
MRSNNSNGSRAASARGFVTFFALMLAMGLGLMASPADAQPFAYVANHYDGTVNGTVSVIDTATTPPSVVATVGMGNEPAGVAVTPDGKQVYVTNFNSNTVSVIDTASNIVVATVGVGLGPVGVAITPDGKHAYVTNNFFNFSVSVIDTTTTPPSVVATVPVGGNPSGVAITPDGQHAMSRIIPPATFR